LRTLTTLDRFGLVTWDDHEPMLRMLQVEELRRAMSFPTAYRFSHGTRRDKIKMIGNGVCPPVHRGDDWKLISATRILSGLLFNAENSPFLRYLST
jgi:hypothetical protein